MSRWSSRVGTSSHAAAAGNYGAHTALVLCAEQCLAARIPSPSRLRIPSSACSPTNPNAKAASALAVFANRWWLRIPAR